MPDQIAIKPILRPIRATIRPPGSKSITNRALICAALADGHSRLSGALDSEDTRVMVDALRQFGLTVQHDVATATIEITGCGGNLPRDAADLFCANSGTTIRFLTGLVAAGRGRFRLDGVARMRERPIEDLLHALRQLGADAVSEAGNGCPPVVVNAHGMQGGQATVRGNISSQFLSALLMAAPYCRSDVELLVQGQLVSVPYVMMTLAVMRSFGVQAAAELNESPRIRIAAGQRYLGCTYDIEPDASAASYFWAVAAITGGRVLVEGLSGASLQGDVQFVDCLKQMGCQVETTAGGIAVQGGPLRGIEVDMNAISDTAQTLGVVALFADGPTTIRGVAHMRHKETDRVVALAAELRKLGARVEEFDDGLRITPAPFRAATIDTYRDHRMAMSFALAGLRIPGVVINDPECTAKTYPNFFSDLAKVTG